MNGIRQTGAYHRLRAVGPVAVILVLLFGGISAGVAGAHEIGTTRVAASVTGEAYRIEVVTDAMSLLEKAEVASGHRRSGTSDPAALQSSLSELAPLLLQRIHVSFDGIDVRPAMQIAVAPSTDVGGVPSATLVLTGTRRATAKAFAWGFGWTFASYALSIQTNAKGEAERQWVEGDDTSTPVALDAVPARVSRPILVLQYLMLGFTHIVPNGLDHVLFVLGIFLLSRKIRLILAQVSAFTIAHSITLALSMYGIVSVSPSVVEPLIALSIAYIAIENLLLREFRPWRVALVFCFGLLHGLGFAGALREVGLPRSEFVTALVSFNAGVELGQLAVIGAAFAAVGYWCGSRIWYRQRIVLPASACIACLGVFWTIQRLHML
jgi:hypothetical protein